MKPKNPRLAAVLGAFGPIGYFYLGWRVAVSALLVWIVVVLTSAYSDSHSLTAAILSFLVQVAGFSFAANRIAIGFNESDRHSDRACVVSFLIGHVLLVWFCTTFAVIACVEPMLTAFADFDLKAVGVSLLAVVVLPGVAYFVSGLLGSLIVVPVVAAINHRRDP